MPSKKEIRKAKSERFRKIRTLQLHPTERIKLVERAEQEEKKGDYHAAGDKFYHAATSLSRYDIRAAAKYATMAEKNFRKVYSDAEQHIEQLYAAAEKTGRKTRNDPEIRKYSMIKYDAQMEGEKAHELAQALRHEAAKRKVKGKGLETHVATAVFLIIGAAGIFFLSPNLTGNVIGNTSIVSTNIVGAILFFLGLIGLFFTFKRNK